MTWRFSELINSCNAAGADPKPILFAGVRGGTWIFDMDQESFEDWIFDMDQESFEDQIFDMDQESFEDHIFDM